MRVIVKVSGQEKELLPGAPPPSDPLARVAGTTLEPQHPATLDAELARWYVAEVADPAAAKQLAEALRGTPGVEAAYVKPGEAPAL